LHYTFWAKNENVESILTSSNRIAVFYNVFTQTNEDVGFVQSIVQEQMAHLLPEHEVFVRSIGIQFNISNTTLLCHDEVGDEVGTLTLLWEYCKEHPKSKAVYIHTKGSFHPHERNNILRKFLTHGALSQECANAPSHCNVCSSRMSPVPHPHTPGNMWLAKCNYIVKLINPMNFTEAMANSFLGSSRPGSPCVGGGRYAAEHWVHSHPTVMPCDLSTNLSYVWNYDHVPMDDFEMILMSAPRFDLKAYQIGHVCQNDGISLNVRLREYDELYAENVTESWWGWKFFI
jgi:hypothetical protein